MAKDGVCAFSMSLPLPFSIFGAGSIVDYFWFDFAHCVANLSPLQSRYIFLFPVLE